MPRKPKMRTRAEIESALCFAEEQAALAGEAADTAPRGLGEYEAALFTYAMWRGEAAAYRFVLRLPSTPDGDR